MRLKTITIAVLVAFCLFQAAIADKEKADAKDADEGGDDDDDDDDDDDTTAAPPPPPPVFDIVMMHDNSDVSRIDVTWESDESFNDEMSLYYIKAQKDGSESVLRTGNINKTLRAYSIQDLVHESKYEICLHGVLANGTDIERCENYNTIKIIRPDSLIVLFLTLGCIILMILLGYFCWSYAKKKAEAEAAEEEEEEDEEKAGNAALLA